MGPAFLVSVALVDPGNWATAIEAGSKFGYELVWVVVVSNLIAILLQTLAARLGIVTGKHLAQVCRESYPPQVCALLWVLCEISIVALDLTMLLGTAIGLNLLLGWPLLPCILLTSLDALLLLLLVPAQGVKKSEALTVGLLAIVVACFLVDLVVSRPPIRSVVSGLLLPRLRRESVYTAVSLLGANVMPHNFYLHSALVSGQAAKAAAAAAAAGSGARQEHIVRSLCLYNVLDIGAALGVALVINVAVLLVSAATFHSAGVVVHTLQAAHDLMEQTLSSSIAPAAFGTALLCAGQLSTFTGTIAGQVVLQGFLNIHISTWLRRLITRTAAIIPAAILQYMYGDRGTYKFLLIAQVVLALQLPVTLVPLIKATSSRKLMGAHACSPLLSVAAWAATGLVFLANLMLFVTQMLPEVSPTSPSRGILDKDGPLDAWLDRVASLAYNDPLQAAGLLGLLVAVSAFLALQLWMIVTPLRVDSAAAAARGVVEPQRGFGAPPPGIDPEKSSGSYGVKSGAYGSAAGRRWFGTWIGGGVAPGSQRPRQSCGRAGGDSYTAAVQPAGQSPPPWQHQSQYQWTSFAWNSGAASTPGQNPFLAVASSGAGFGADWVVPSSAIRTVIGSGLRPYDISAAVADATLLPLPWRPLERYGRRRSSAFYSEGYSDSGSDSDSSEDGEGVSGRLVAGSQVAELSSALAEGAVAHAALVATVLSAHNETQERRNHRKALTDHSIGGAAQAAVTGPITTHSESIWMQRLSLPPTHSTPTLGEAEAARVFDDSFPAASSILVAADADVFGPAPALGPGPESGVSTRAPPGTDAGTVAAAACAGAAHTERRPMHPVSRGTRPKFARLLEDFWASFYDGHGRPVRRAQEGSGGQQLQQQQQRHERMQGAGGRDGGGGGWSRGGQRCKGDGDGDCVGGVALAAESPAAAFARAAAAVADTSVSPLLCSHTEGSHLCMGCSQALFEAVRQCLGAFEQLEDVASAVWGTWPLQLLPPNNQTFDYHRAILMATRNADFPSIQALCEGTYTSRVDQSKLLAATPLLAHSAGALSPLAVTPELAGVAPFIAVTRAPSGCPTRGEAARIGPDEASVSQGPSQLSAAAHHPQYLHKHQRQHQEHSQPRTLCSAQPPSKHDILQLDAVVRPLSGAKRAAHLLDPHASTDTVPTLGGVSSPQPDAVEPRKRDLVYTPSAGRSGCGSGPALQLTGKLPVPQSAYTSERVSWLRSQAQEQAQVLPAPLRTPSVLGTPTFSSWCLFGPAALVSFGVWSIFTLAQWCQADPRPAHWGQYASVLNRLQGVLRDARLDVTAVVEEVPVAVGAAAVALVSVGVEPLAGHSGVSLSHDSPLSSCGLQLHSSSPEQQQPQQQRGRHGAGQRGFARAAAPAQQCRQQQQPHHPHSTQQQQQLADLPVTALRLCPAHLDLLRGELLRQLEGMEAHVLERRGPADTAAGQVAFPKAKEIIASVMRRYRRRLLGAGGSMQQATAGGGCRDLQQAGLAGRRARELAAGAAGVAEGPPVGNSEGPCRQGSSTGITSRERQTARSLWQGGAATRIPGQDSLKAL